MKKAKRIDELHIGQKIYVKDQTDEKEFTVRSLEDKFVPYVIATDNSCHSIRKGIWISD